MDRARVDCMVGSDDSGGYLELLGRAVQNVRRQRVGAVSRESVPVLGASMRGLPRGWI